MSDPADAADAGAGAMPRRPNGVPPDGAFDLVVTDFDRTIFTGWMPDEMVAAAYARADVLVLPSDIEGFGLTPFEAWGYRKPCILTTGCGASEVVHDGLTGFTVPPNDSAALAEALDRVLADPEQAQRMGESGRIALRGFTAPAAAEKEWGILEDARRRFERKA